MPILLSYSDVNVVIYIEAPWGYFTHGFMLASIYFLLYFL